MLLDYKTGLTDLIDEAGRVRVEPPSPGTPYRLQGLAADIAEVTQWLRTVVLAKASKVVALDAADVDCGELSERVLALEMDENAVMDDALREQVHLVNEGLLELSSVLDSIAGAQSRHLTIEEYEKLYYDEMKRYGNSGAGRHARKTYEEWREKECYGTPDMEALLEYRFDKVVRMFEKGTFAAEVEHMRRTTKYPGELDFETMDDPEARRRAFRSYHALRKLVDYDKGMLTVNAYHAGHHFYTTKDAPNAKSLRNLFLKYMKKIELAQDDMRRLQEAVKSASEPQLNYFAPAKNLKELLRQPWFKEMRSKAEYDGNWTDGLVDGLMHSEWRDLIAREWDSKDRRLMLKCMIVGLLKDMDVVRGSYNSIARRLDMDGENPATLAKYMGAGKKQPFAEWVEEYVGK